MFAPFDETLAARYCRSLMRKLDGERCLDFEDAAGNPIPAGERSGRFSTSYVFSGARGQMFGVLVCRTAAGGTVVLKAFSGQYNGCWNVPGWVPPLLDTAAYDAITARDDAEIKSLSLRIASAQTGGSDAASMAELKRLRKELSRRSLVSVYRLYRFPCADGTVRTFDDFYGGFRNGTAFPPTGTGDCCAPKLLGYAFAHRLQPLSLAEFFYGAPNRSGTRVPGCFYPPCDEKCGIVLPVMLGIEIVYRDEHCIVLNKPAGLLSVPGRGEDKQDCAVHRLRRLYPDCIAQPSVHRLDMDTSGLLVLALTADAHRCLSRQFMEGTVHKEYEALLRGKPCGAAAQSVCADRDGLCGFRAAESGRIELPFRLDVENRPRQVFDPVYGKTGVTEWRFIGFERCGKETSSDGVLTRVRFTPLTGRTHQLRLHSMHPNGLGAPIRGDRLYGTRLEGERLALHAALLSFTHPVSGERMTFTSAVPF